MMDISTATGAEEQRSASIQLIKISIASKLVFALESPSAASCSIFRVPELIRRHKKEAYTPTVVSIGPFHIGGRPQFKLMQNVKVWYLRCLLTRFEFGHGILDSLIEDVTKLEDRARNSYEEDLSHLSSVEFLEIMILDGSFLLELFMRTDHPDFRDENDPIFNQNYMLEFLCHDLLLLENQIPWFVLECLLQRYNDFLQPSHLVFKFFDQHLGYVRMDGFDGSSCEVLHILDLIRTRMIRTLMLSNSDPEEETPSNYLGENLMRIPNATTLEDSGFKLNSSSSSSPMKAKFESGVFTIPSIKIDDKTEALLRNVIALEQCHHSRPRMITSYAFLMDNLIHSIKDIDLLCYRGIITVNRLSYVDASMLFSNICIDIALAHADFYHRKLFIDVTEHYRTPCNVLKDILRKWMKILQREYFSTPWKVMSWIAAFILLILTLLQTLYTMKQYYNSK